MCGKECSFFFSRGIKHSVYQQQLLLPDRLTFLNTSATEPEDRKIRKGQNPKRAWAYPHMNTCVGKNN